MKGEAVSDDLEVARKLPVGDRLAELALLPLPRHGVVIDEDVTEQAACRLRGDQPAGRVRQCARKRALGRMFLLISIASNGFAGFDLVLDTPEPRSERRGDRK